MSNKSREYIKRYRREYEKGELEDAMVTADPFELFDSWFSEVVKKGIPDANAMALATCTKTCLPTCRIVLLRDFDKFGFVFFTNYNSAKAKEITENPVACINFYWHQFNRQVRIEGALKKIPEEESDTYFKMRPRESQLSAWASPQSEIIKSRAVLLDKIKDLEKKHEGKLIPRPPYWGGYRLKPVRFEFWQGKPGRLHDRFSYAKTESGDWKVSRLAP